MLVSHTCAGIGVEQDGVIEHKVRGANAVRHARREAASEQRHRLVKGTQHVAGERREAGVHNARIKGTYP